MLATAVLAVALAAGFDHSLWEEVLKRHVNELGEVDYAGLQANGSQLREYVSRVAAKSPDSHPEEFRTASEQLAYWLNAYNALVVAGVVRHWPTRGVRDLGANFEFFKQREYVAGGRRVSLDDIEHEIIRKRFREPRIHFALVCASISCPRLGREAFRGATLEAQLERQTRQFLTERRNVEYDKRRGVLRLSALFRWYGEDFGGVVEFVRRYRPDIGEPRRVRYFDYDWGVNSVGARARAASTRERELAGRR
jgi:hypothetical protein